MVLIAVAIYYDVAWSRGDDIHVPGVGIVRRFPCSGYDVPSGDLGTTQAFAVIDGAALAAQSQNKKAVTTLVDAVFDREVPMIRCGNPLRRRVAEAEWQFRRRAQPPIAERTLVDVANSVLTNAGAPTWARISVEELHVLRTVLRPDFNVQNTVLARFAQRFLDQLGFPQ